MRPTGQLHLGNYFGAIKQFLDLQAAGNDCFYFVADIHALTEADGRTEIDRLSIEVAKNYLACGVNPDVCALYRQSDLPEVSEVCVLLGNTIGLGVLERCTTFKDRISNRKLDRAKVSLGLLQYPVLMAADILCVRADCVPVGDDQRQHVEMARDFAKSFNHRFDADVFVVPRANAANPLRVPGTDGSEKMGKSDGNTIALLEDPATCRKKVMRIPTQTSMGVEMGPGTRAIYALTELCSPPHIYDEYVRRYESGDGKFFGEMKQRLADDILELLTSIQTRYQEIKDDDVRDILAAGAAKAKPVAASVLEDMRRAMGLRS